jgi:thiol:disulfide interchange protein DsbD
MASHRVVMQHRIGGGELRSCGERLLQWVLPWLALLVLVGCGDGESDSFTYWVSRYGIAGGCLGAYFGGLLVSLTPCVYPMIVITVSVFGANPTKNRGRAVLLSSAFVGGLCAMYTPLGVAAGLTGNLFGAALASPWVVGAIVVVLVALASSMFGLWEMALPAAWQTRLSGVGGVGPGGAFLMGLVAGILAAPCAGPVTVALLTFVGTSGNPWLGALYFLTYALGIGTLFFLVGAFAFSLPRGGRWTESIKSVFGVAILVMAAYYLRLVVPHLAEVQWRSPWLLAPAVIACLAGLALGAVHLSLVGADFGQKVRKLVALGLLTGGASVLLWASLTVGEAIAWRDDYGAAIAEARDQNRPLLLDFTADWCGACQELARETFSHGAVALEAQRFVAVRVDATRQTPAIEQIMENHEVRGLPTVLLLSRDGTEASRVTEFIEAGPMLELLRQVP